MNNFTTEAIWLAALLHDIGKFWQRADPNAGMSHQDYGRRFVQNEFGDYFKPLNAEMEQAIAAHHAEPITRIQKLIQIADHLSMREDERENTVTHDSQWEPLSALLTCEPLAPSPALRKKIRLQTLPMQGEEMMPAALGPDSAENYAVLWGQFAEEFARFTSGRQFEQADINSILSLLHKYTSCMPAQTQLFEHKPETEKTPLDVSLYLHLKTTAAIAACLHEEQLSDEQLDALSRGYNDQASRPFCALVKGDISGTQDFLYLLTSDGAARGLRARSFYLQLLTEAIAQWLLHQAGLSEINLLFTGGGHFYALLPHTKTANEIENWRKEISEKLWQAHQGDLYLNLGYVPVSCAEFLENNSGGESPFAAKWAEVSVEVSSHKQKKWLELGTNAMHDELFSSQESGGVTLLCEVCRFEGAISIVDGEPSKCQRCRAFEKLGKKLRAPRYMITFPRPAKKLRANPSWEHVLAAFGVGVRVGASHKQERINGKNATLWLFDSHMLWPEESEISPVTSALQDYQWKDSPPRRRTFRLLAAATPSKWDEESQDDVVAEFTDLAQAADGAKWLGVLRMDVDSLGQVFKNGLGTKANIARMATLSESLRLFFESRVPELCRKQNSHSLGALGAKDKLFLLYAGGDDLFLIGAWNELPALANEIHKEFRRFVGDSDHLTLSAGIAIEHDKYPLYQLANDAKHALDERAKEHSRPAPGRAKDAICFLQTVVGWEDFLQLNEWQEKLVEMIKPSSGGGPRLSRGFLMRLSEIHTLFAENRKRMLRLHRQSGNLQRVEEVIYYEKWRWRLTYQLDRFAERYSDYHNTIIKLRDDLINNRRIDNLNLIARWAELLTRKE